MYLPVSTHSLPSRRPSELLTESLSSVDRQLRAHWRRLANQDFRPIIAVGGLLERIDFAADLGRRLAECGKEAIQIADSIPADVLRDTIMRVRCKRRELEKERIAITREPEVDEFLVALAAARATLRPVSGRVRAWLDAQRAHDR